MDKALSKIALVLALALPASAQILAPLQTQPVQAVTPISIVAGHSTSNTSGSGAVTTSFSPANGNALFVATANNAHTAATCSDSEGTGNTYTLLADVDHPTALLRERAFIATNISGSGTYTITCTGTTPTVFVVELANYHGVAGVSSRVYNTAPSGSENPISQGGNWKNGLADGTAFRNCRIVSGIVRGTQAVGETFLDSVCAVTGSWSGNQSAQITINVTSAGANGTIEEAEAWTNATIVSNSITGYEANCSVMTSQIQIVRWDGGQGHGGFTQIFGNPGTCVNGDTLKLTNVGGTLTVFRNGSAVGSVTDTTYSAGSPGMGLYVEGGSGSPSTANNDYGISAFTFGDFGTSNPSTANDANVPLVGFNTTDANVVLLNFMADIGGQNPETQTQNESGFSALGTACTNGTVCFLSNMGGKTLSATGTHNDGWTTNSSTAKLYFLIGLK